MNISVSDFGHTGVEFGILITMPLYFKTYPLTNQGDRILAKSLIQDMKSCYREFTDCDDYILLASLSTEIYQLWEEFSSLYPTMLEN